MKTNTFVIGSMDDFETINELIDYVEANGTKGFRNYSVFEFDAPDQCNPDTITMIGRGHAFSNDWCMDHTFSFVIEGVLGSSAEEASSAAAAKVQEMMKGTTSGDSWDPSDPANW